MYIYVCVCVCYNEELFEQLNNPSYKSGIEFDANIKERNARLN